MNITEQLQLRQDKAQQELPETSVRLHKLNKCFFQQAALSGKSYSEQLQYIFMEGNRLHKLEQAKHPDAICETHRNYKTPYGTIVYTPDILYPGYGIELKFTNASIKNLPYLKDVRQTRAYAGFSQRPFTLKYYSRSSPEIQLLNIHVPVMEGDTIKQMFEERAKVWFSGQRPRNPLAGDCQWCPLKTGECYQWLQEQQNNE